MEKCVDIYKVDTIVWIVVRLTQVLLFARETTLCVHSFDDRSWELYG